MVSASFLRAAKPISVIRGFAMRPRGCLHPGVCDGTVARFAEIKLIIILSPCSAWFDGAAIYMAVLIVSGFSALVDWRKEREFVRRSQADEDAKFVSKKN